MAAKSYYFGVGGGTRQFEDVVRADGTCVITTLRRARLPSSAKQTNCAADVRGGFVGDRLHAGGASTQLRGRGVQREGAAAAGISQSTDLIYCV